MLRDIVVEKIEELGGGKVKEVSGKVEWLIQCRSTEVRYRDLLAVS